MARALFAGLICTILLVPTTALATPILYDTRSSFDSATPGSSTITFDEFIDVRPCQPSHPYIPDPCSFSTGGVTFTTTVGYDGAFNQRPLLGIFSPDGIGPNNRLTSAQVPTERGHFTVAFTGDAIGLDLFGGPIRIVLSEIDGTDTIFDMVLSPQGFFGAASDVGFVGASIFALPLGGAYGPSNFSLDNVTTRASSVPEPTTLLLTGLALPFVVRRARRSGTPNS